MAAPDRFIGDIEASIDLPPNSPAWQYLSKFQELLEREAVARPCEPLPEFGGSNQRAVRGLLALPQLT